MRWSALFCCGVFVLWSGGCASKSPVVAGEKATAAHVVDDPAFYTLEQILPVPELPAPATRPATKVTPTDALVWFAQGHEALATGQRQTAINCLEKAMAVDPNSVEIYEELARAYGGQEKAVWAYEKALALDPDNLSLREKLGRQYLIKNKVDEALLQFRLAVKCSDYETDNESAAVVDFFLARALQRKGYDRAALDQYSSLIKRLDHPNLSPRTNPELLSLLSQPETLYGQIGELYEKHQEYSDAVKAYELAVERVPDSFDFQEKLTRSLAAAGRGDEAAARAAEVVSRFRASGESLKLLHETYKKLNREKDVIGVLSKLQREKPKDQAILFALADALSKANRMAEAEKLLADSAKLPGSGDEIIKRIFTLYDERGDVEGAMGVLINALARNPDSLRQLSPLWSDLLRPSRRNRPRLAMLQNMHVSKEAEASRLFWVSRVADLWNRDALARAALEQGAAISPAFPPLYRALVSDYWNRADWDDKQKIEMTGKLVEAARSQGNAAFAAELEGLSLLHQRGQVDAAAERLALSIRLGNKAPDVQLTHAIALKAGGNGGRAESLLWKVVSDNPTYEDAYVELFRYYFDQSQPAKAVNVLSKWLAADPGNVHARVLRARLMQQAGRNDSAESELLSLFRDQPESAEILGALYDFYTDTRRVEDFVNKLEEERKARPDNREAVEQLVLIYYAQKRLPEALRALEGAREAVKNDPDLLYYIAHVYGRIDQKETEEQLLTEVIKLDPRNAPASNDLGYSWADAAKNLGRAEELIRLAVETEPDNQSFLDSLGWVLYKRAKFEEALTYFEKAIGPANRPDPVVLDHMGDVLYRLSQADVAAQKWRRAQQRLDEIVSERDDLKKLRLQLIQKLKQYEAHQAVDVAPTAAVEKEKREASSR